MKRALIALAALQLLGAPALAADDAQAPERQRREPTAEEKAQHEQRRKEWEAMTPEQREAKRQEMREHRGQRGKRRQ